MLDQSLLSFDKKRNNGGSFDVGTEDDGGIVEMYNLNGKMLVIKERSVYEVIFADTLDPERKFIKLHSFKPIARR